MKRVLKRVTAISLLVLLVVLTTYSTTMAAGPRQYSFGYNYGANDINTNSDASQVHNALNKMGYYAPYYYTNNSGKVLQTVIGDSAVFYVTAHGGPGLISCRDTSGRKTYLTAKSSSNNIAYSLEAKYGKTSSKLRRVRLAFFNGCKTALTSPTYGNLLIQARDYGVDLSIGFTQNVTVGHSKYFADRVIRYYGADKNNTLRACIESSKKDTFRQFGSYGGVNSVSTTGNGGTKLVPAAYGVY